MITIEKKNQGNFEKLTNKVILKQHIEINVGPQEYMLSRFFHVQLCATPGTTAHQAPLSMEFSSQEYWSRLPFRKQINKQRKQTNNNNNKLQNLKTKAYESNG